MTETKCRICGNNALLVQKGIESSQLRTNDFAITDAGYGNTADIYECQKCGFKFCPTVVNANDFYQALEDNEYELGRGQRALQARKLVDIISLHKSSGNWLDIGAGSGILVEQATLRGFAARGIEPSIWLAEQGRKHGLDIQTGTFPKDIKNENYDVITLVDVLEHVENPLQLLEEIAKYLKPEGIALIITPDINSLMARVMGRRWWHYRIAHIGYFSRKTLKLAFEQADLEDIEWFRPSWYFSLQYLFERIAVYLPPLKIFAKVALLGKTTVPLNLFDSWGVIVRRNNGKN